jgi:putative endopeptidase
MRIAIRWTIELVVVSVLCAGLMAQTEADGKAATGKTLERLPGLDKRLIDTTADPCTDFFRYACGNFSKLYPIPNDRSAYGTGAMIADYTEQILRSMLEKAAAGGADRTPNEQKIGDLYAACMDVDAINQNGLKPLQPDLDRIAGLKSKDELPELLAHFQLIGANAFLSFGEQEDFKDARKQIALADQGGLGLPERDYYFREGAAAEKTRAQYVQHIANMLKLIGEPESRAAADA